MYDAQNEDFNERDLTYGHCKCFSVDTYYVLVFLEDRAADAGDGAVRVNGVSTVAYDIRSGQCALLVWLQSGLAEGDLTIRVPLM